MLKESETYERIVFFVAFLSLIAFQLGGGPDLLPPNWLRLWSQISDYFKMKEVKQIVGKKIQISFDIEGAEF